MSISSFDFSSWPPTFTNDQLAELTRLATTYALAHGLLYLPVNSNPPPAPTSAIHAPIALVPAPFPRALFNEVKRLQRIYNVLYARIALDIDFLDEVMGEGGGVADVDDFTRQLWRIWKSLRDEGLTETTHLGIFRSDYLLHAPSSEEPISLKQVEFNTISSSFGALSERAAALHRYLLAATNYYGTSPLSQSNNLPENKTTSTIAEALASAHHKYGVKDAYILFVVQPNERNVFDQRWVEYELLERYSIKVIRQTLSELSSSATVHTSDRTLTISTPTTSSTTTISKGNERGIEIAVVYYRAGYTPTDYPEPSYYETRKKLSRSRAINCPTLALQLAGGKKIQQVLTRPGVLERFLSGDNFGPETYTEADINAIRSSWVSMWGLDEPGGVEKALEQSSPSAESHTGGLVLKPQREGGGNNVYKEDIPPFLEKLPVEERAAWIAMALIQPPEHTGGYLVRAGSGSSTGVGEKEETKKPVDVISELGVFGWALFSDGHKGQKVEEREGGWLVRTKGKESNEGGVAVGFSVLDSVLLVD